MTRNLDSKDLHRNSIFIRLLTNNHKKNFSTLIVEKFFFRSNSFNLNCWYMLMAESLVQGINNLRDVFFFVAYHRIFFSFCS